MRPAEKAERPEMEERIIIDLAAFPGGAMAWLSMPMGSIGEANDGFDEDAEGIVDGEAV